VNNHSSIDGPAVTVILPVYNGENYLRIAIESVLAQTLSNFELIIVDDGSTDSTSDIARVADPRVRYVRQQNTGVAGAFNHGLRLATGRYVSWLSHDDVFAPAKLEKQLAVLESIGMPAVCYTDFELIDGAGKVVLDVQMPEYEDGAALPHVLMAEAIGSASYSICYHRRCVEEVGFYSERWPHTQDAEMLIRLVRRFPLVRVAENLMQVRDHEQRGIRSPEWEREVVRFYRDHLAATPFEVLFPETSARVPRAERSRCYLALGDSFAAKPFPLYRVAYSQYWKALRENPVYASHVLRRIAELYRSRRHERTRP
jgi:glycosyltransferase involved in cell wall biosynthesis